MIHKVTVSIDSPSDGAAVGTSVDVTGHGSVTNATLDSVDVSVGPGPSETATLHRSGNTFSWSYSRTVTQGGPITITAEASAHYFLTGHEPGEPPESIEVTGVATISVVVVTAPPDLAITSPIPSSAGDVPVVGTAAGYTLRVTGTASAPQIGVHDVSWIGDWVAGPPTSGQATLQAGLWDATIQVPLGVYTITFTCTDNAGRTQAKTLRVRVALPADIFSTDPQQYLQALIEFATQPAISKQAQAVARIQVLGRDATPRDLEQTFGQPFSELTPPLYQRYQRKAIEPVHKIRLAIEVLRNLLRLYPPPSPQTVASAERAYLQAAYATLLTQVGTSYDELRLARAYADPARLAVADRIGIATEHLQPLLLDPVGVSETVLECLFGLQDTTRDPLSDGPTVGDTQPAQIVRWTLDGVDWKRNTDADGFCYVTVTKPADGSLHVNVYRDSSRSPGTLVASGQVSAPWSNPVAIPLGPQHDSGIRGTSSMVVDYRADTSAIALSVIPRLLSWQLLRLQARWAAEDFPPVLTVVSPTTAQPGQDLSVTITGQFTHFLQGKTTATFGAGITVASLTVNSPNGATAVLSIDAAAADGVREITLRTGTETVTLHDGFRILAAVAGQPTLTQVSPTAAEPGQQNLSVSITGLFTHFQQGTTTAYFGPGITVASLSVNSPTDATAVLNIDPAAAEGARDVTLTTTAEVVTLTDGLTLAAAVGGPPLIDPDLLFPDDFSHPLASDQAYGMIYLARQQVLQTWYDNLKLQREAASPPLQHGLDAILSSVLGSTSADLSALDQQRRRGDDISWQLATMNLSVPAFNYLLHVIALLESIQSPGDLLASEWDDVYNILVQAQKAGASPIWRSEEQAQNLTLSPDWFQIAPAEGTTPPPRSPWRAAPALRRTWLNTLKGRMNQRNDLIQGLRAAVDATEVATLSILRDGPTGSDGLVDALIISVPIPELSSTGMETVAPPGQSPVDRHWTIIRTPSGDTSTAATVTQTRPATWLANSTTSKWISPLADEQQGIDPAGTYTYRTMCDLTGLDPGSARISVKVAVDNTVADVLLNGTSRGLTAQGFQQFTTLAINDGFSSGLNALDFVVNNAGTAPNPTGLRLEFSSSINVLPSGNKLTEWFLIDIECSSYQTTTRLGQAIETLQDLFFSLRTGKFHELPKLEGWQLTETPADFDKEWNWMGAYATWVAAMRVFLYPENLLFPLLRSPDEISRPFITLVESLNESGVVSPEEARQAASTYWTELVGLFDPPINQDPGPLSDTLTDVQLGTLAAEEQAAFTQYRGATQPLSYLREAFFFVPIYIASQLQQAGQFSVALSWYRIVYAYDLADAKIYYGLLSEEYTPTRYDLLAQWLRDPLNPHDFAAVRANAYTRFTLLSLIRLILDFADTEYASDSFESLPRARTLYLTALDLLDLPALQPPSDPRVAPNPVPAALRQHAETNLLKLRTSRDIAGLVRVSDPATLRPTVYRFATLIDRAKQLVTLAQQVESSFLAALEKTDAEKYTALRAQQDLQSAGANVKLQSLRVQEASDSVTLASDQRQRAGIQVNHYNDLLDSDILTLEALSISMQGAELELQLAAGFLYTAAAAQSGFSLWGLLTSESSATQAAATAASTFAAAAGTGASILSATASLEEKQKDWHFQLDLAQQDQVIANQQYLIAQDQQSVALQEHSIAQTQQDHAQAVVDFLTTQKFTTAVLYQWMSSILQRVYSYFLQQASAVARMAQNQLAFERQLQTPSFIQADYWQAASNTGAGGATAQPINTKGLTGSARLLQDITQLDQYAFQTDQRKLQLTKMISLARLEPFAFQQFRETGLLRFATPMDLFDRDFPGHLLRLIKRVRASVIALIPPMQGIRATLSNPGISRVVVPDASSGFQTATVRREPQLIALTSPANSTGLFDLADTQSGMLLPFENLGVDTVWELLMPQAANPFDYASVADVLLTVEYTALDSPDYRQQVIRQLERSVSAERAYSFRHQFADAWYDLNNPDPGATHITVSFQTARQDFPPNVSDLAIAQVLLYFVPVEGASFQIQATLHLTQSESGGSTKTVGGTASLPTDPNALGAVFSTRRGNASAWIPMIGLPPVGSWALDVPNTPNTPNPFQGGQIQDILFVITYNGGTPAWPG